MLWHTCGHVLEADLEPGSAWGDWSLYTDSPLRAFENETGHRVAARHVNFIWCHLCSFISIMSSIIAIEFFPVLSCLLCLCQLCIDRMQSQPVSFVNVVNPLSLLSVLRDPLGQVCSLLWAFGIPWVSRWAETWLQICRSHDDSSKPRAFLCTPFTSFTWQLTQLTIRLYLYRLYSSIV